jgi:hypothetical protein
MNAAGRDLWQAFRALPRALQWSAWALIGTAVAVVYLDYVVATAAGWNASAEKLLTSLRDASRRLERQGAVRRLAEPIRAIGPVEKPGPHPQATTAMTEAVNRILKRHRVSNESYAIGALSRLPIRLADTLRARGAQRVRADLKFDATPDDAIEVIGELEQSPEIESIEQVHVARIGGAQRQVTVNLTMEVWVR